MCGNYVTTLAVFNCQKSAINTPDRLKTVQAEFVLGTFDLPAKASVLQYNGEFGCCVCLHPGKQLENDTSVYLAIQQKVQVG